MEGYHHELLWNEGHIIARWSCPFLSFLFSHTVDHLSICKLFLNFRKLDELKRKCACRRTGECCLNRGSSAQDLCPSIVSVSQSYVSQGWFLKNGAFNYTLTVKERALFKHINLWVLYFNTVVTKTCKQFGRKWKVL